MNSKLDILKTRFGYTAFRPGQEEVIDAILSGRDALAVMPTGAGKSLCYQIPALLLPGMSVVISPLISLMKDQVHALRSAGVPAAFLNSSLSPAEYGETMTEILLGGVKLLYIAPERLRKTEAAFSGKVNIPLVVVDEAHCVSQWGHDFRPGYLDIASFIAGLKTRPVTAAFTATATPRVRVHIRELLELRGDAFLVTTGFDRPNLYFEVLKPQDKNAALVSCLEERANSSGIVYCSTRKAAEEVYSLLLRRGYPVSRYHAGLEDEERHKNQDDFLYDRKKIMVATNAFGMGIDKANVSFVIHYNMPKNIESYYQEAGRAGRDGEDASCILLYNGRDVKINEYLIKHIEEDEEPDPVLLAYNLDLLKQMTFYAAGNSCLREKLLSYFGEETPSFCGRCSVCLTEYEKIDVTIEARKIISCVYRLKERNRSFGKTMIADILRGNKSEKLLRFGLDELSTWGIMKDTPVHRIRAILDSLVEEGWLIQEQGEYPVISFGRAGELLKEGKTFCIMLPKEKENGISEKPPGVISGKSGGVKSENAAAGAESYGIFQAAGKISRRSKAAAQTEDAADAGLFAMLRELRKETAAREGFPAYIVFPDSSLKDMCVKKPVTLAQFSLISGVGELKLKKYGGAFTAAIKNHLKI